MGVEARALDRLFVGLPVHGRDRRGALEFQVAAGKVLRPHLERQPELGRLQPLKVGVLGVVDEELLIGLFAVDVPGQLGRRDAVATQTGDVHFVVDVVPGLTAQNIRSRVGEI